MNSEDIVLYFSKYIEKELGIIYSATNLYQLQNRLEEVIKVLNIPDLNSLYKDVQTNSPRFKKQTLLDIATNNETSFFRDPRVFRSMEVILNELIISCEKKREKLKIWSVASSTGQEPISVAILMEELLEKSSAQTAYEIYCTDISERVLKRAQAASFSELEVQRGINDKHLAKFFKKEADRWLANHQITKNLTFERQNIKEKFSHPGQFHFILCRNILIYQGIESKIEILDRLADSLVVGGHLLLGAGESLIGLSTKFEQEMIDGAVFYKKK